MLTCLLLIATLAQAPNLLANGDFSSGLESWKPSGDGITIESRTIDGRKAARLTVEPDVPLGYPGLAQRLPVTPGDLVEGRVAARAEGVKDGYGLYIAVEYYDADGKRIAWNQSEPLVGDTGWSELTVRGVVPPNAVQGSLVLLINGHGAACFADARVGVTGHFAETALDGPVTLRVTDEVVCDSFLGFGFEDDGWFYNPENAEHGVTEEDYAIREARIDWMNPDRVRMFFWIEDYCPSGDWETYTWDSPNMLSHYRTLDQYQRLGTDINLTDVEWGFKAPYDDVPKAARGIATLFEHLIKDRGYTCVKYWTLTNEPNGSWVPRGDTYEHYAALTQAVREEFKKRQLPVEIVGSDDTSGLEWFRKCVADPQYLESARYFSSHRYCPYPDWRLGELFLKDRLELLQGRKPLCIEEFGFQDNRSGTFENPIMMTYPYALWTSAFCLDGLNQGVAGFSIWALHEVYYPGNGFMEYALWEFKDDNWKVRPVYHAWANFCRLTEKGDKVRKCESSSPSLVKAARIGDTLFWVNVSDQAAQVHVDGMPLQKVRIHTEDTLHGDRECGTEVPADGGSFTAPPLSFGYAR